MKKILKIIMIVFAAILVLLIVSPLLFKNKIEQFVKDKVNENVIAVVDWDNFGINFFRGFPNLSVNMKGMSVTGLDPFAGDTLAGFERFEVQVKPFSAIKGDLIVEAIILSRPLINGVVLEDGQANWDVLPPGEEEIPDEETEGTTSKGVKLKRFSIKEGRIFYDDAVLDAIAAIEGFNLELKGDFSMEQTDLDLQVSAGRVNAWSGGIRYLKDAVLKLSLIAGADMVNSVYTLKENEISINELLLGMEGSVAMPPDADMILNLNFFTRETTFKTLLSMVPAVYLQGFESVQTNGSLQLSGSITGAMNESRNPDAKLNLVVKDGYFNYPDLPKDVRNIQVNLDVNYNGANQDLTTIDLSTFHLEIADNPIDVSLHMATPMSDMSVRGEARGAIDFASLADVVPMDDVQLDGRLETDISINTRLSYIENEDYENVDVEGKLIITNVRVNSSELPVDVDLQVLDMLFSPKFVYLNKMDVVMGSSDLHMDGRLSNFIPYIFKGQTVSGELNVTSNLIDANPFLSEQDSTEQADEGTQVTDSISPAGEDTVNMEPSFIIPENIDFRMRMGVKKILYDKMTIENLMGYIYVHEGVATLEELSLNILEGKVIANGNVDTRNALTHVNIGLDVNGIDIPKSYETFITVEKLAPMAKYCQGRVNTKMVYESFLDNALEPVYETINARGNLSTTDLKIYNLKSFVRLSELLKNDKFKNMVPDDLSLAFKVRDGRVLVDPFDIKFSDSKMKVYGSHGIDMTMDYNLDMVIAKKDLGAGANELLSGINALAAGAGVKMQTSDFVKVKAHIGGTFENPDIRTDMSENLKGMTQTVEKQVREKVEEEIQQKEEEIREVASDKADKIIREAEEEAARIMAQAEKAGEDLVKEAERQGENLVKEAGSNPLKKVAAQKAADELKKQAEKQSKNLLNEAQIKADKVISQAKAEAEKI